jgi:hypothetical protein
MAGVTRTAYPGIYTAGQTPGAPTNLKAPTGPGSGVQGTYTPDDVYSGNAPAGYEWNPIDRQYMRTPTSTGSRAAEGTNAYLQGVGLGNLGGTLTGALGGLSGGATGAFGIGGTGQMQPNYASAPLGVGTGSSVGHVAAPDTSAAESAAFGSAKDKVGQNAKAALQALNDQMAAQGMLGSGAQVQGARDIIQSGMGELGDVRRQQAITKAGSALDLAKMGYQGDITQRGQDISAQEANARLAQEAAQLQFQRQQSALQQQMGLMQLAMSGLKGLY